MVARSDGRIYTYKVDTKTGELVVRNGLNIKTGQPEPYNPDEPAGYYKNNKGVEEAIWCKGVGRIRVVVPELKRFAYLLLMTTSLHDIANLSEQLAGIYESNHHRIAGVPFILQRKPRKVSCPDPNDKTKRARRTKWLLSIEPNPLWVESKLLSMGKEALMLDPGQQRMMALPSGMPKQNPQAGPEPVIEADWTNVAPAEDFNDDDGYEDEPGEPEMEDAAETAAPSPAPIATTGSLKMSLEMANDVQTSDHKRYGDLPMETLEQMYNAICSKIDKNGLKADEKEALTFKRDAIDTIRASQPLI
jgi:hypothetical protein